MHFLSYVLVPIKPRDAAHANELVQPMLAPYNENLEVPEHDEQCWCVGRAADTEVHQQLKIGERRKQMHKDYSAEFDPLFEEECKKLDINPSHPPGNNSPPGARKEWYRKSDAARRAASERVVPSWMDRHEALDAEIQARVREHPMYNKPSPDCDECEGTGTVKTTRNPDGRWDWYQIGGRWNGYLAPEYDPNKDPKNTEICFLCAGSGTRSDGHFDGKRCNGCDGKGHRTSWPTQWSPDDAPEGGNWRKVADILTMIEDGFDGIPYTIVTPGEGWNGKHWRNTQAQDKKWSEVESKELLEKYRDHYAVVVDYHC